MAFRIFARLRAWWRLHRDFSRFPPAVLVFGVLLLTSACSGSNPTAPSLPPVVPPTPTNTLTGTLTATNGGQPLPGITATLSTVTSTSDAAGRFSSTLPTTGNFVLALSGSAIVPRQLTIALFGPRTMTFDAIAVGGGFDPAFYRQFVRNGLESPTPLPLRRWTRNPNLFVQTTTVANAATIDMAERTIRDAVPRWTAGQFGIAAVERGPGTREGQAGWITVKWIDTNDGHCGAAQVAVEGGYIELHTRTPGCGCAGYDISPTAVRHETGHAMGFWHTGSASDVMVASDDVCDKPVSDRELYHARIAYSRPVGNADPDTDPASVVNLAPLMVR